MSTSKAKAAMYWTWWYPPLVLSPATAPAMWWPVPTRQLFRMHWWLHCRWRPDKNCREIMFLLVTEMCIFAWWVTLNSLGTAELIQNDWQCRVNRSARWYSSLFVDRLLKSQVTFGCIRSCSIRSKVTSACCHSAASAPQSREFWTLTQGPTAK